MFFHTSLNVFVKVYHRHMAKRQAASLKVRLQIACALYGEACIWVHMRLFETMIRSHDAL